jgi:hypothetical protein
MIGGPAGALIGAGVGAIGGAAIAAKQAKELERLEKERLAEEKRQAEMQGRIAKLSEPPAQRAGVVSAPSTVATAAPGASTYDRWMRSMFGG